MRNLTRLVVLLLLVIGIEPVTAQTPPSSLPSIADKTKGFEKLDGFVPLYWNRADGTLWLEIPALDTELLYDTSLSAGLGSNDIGLDRGQLGRRARRPLPARRQEGADGGAELRASARRSDEPRRAARGRRGRSRRSVLWGFEVGAEAGGRVLVDATEFLLRDVHDVRPQPQAGELQPRRVAQRGQPRPHQGVPAQHRDRGDPDVHQQRRAAPARPAAACPAGRVTDVAPTARAPSPCSSTTRSCELPDAGYEPRAFDPRAGAFATSYMPTSPRR